MSNTLKITGIVVIALLLTGVFMWAFLSNVQNALGITRTVTPGFQDQEYLLNATSSATARSGSYSIAGAQKVTLFIGSTFASELADEANFSFEVSDTPEPAQGVAIYGTSTPVTRTVDDVEVPMFVFGTTSPFALAGKAFGTTTVSIDLRQNTYAFLRVIRTTDTANRSTSTVSIINSY